MLSRKDRRAQAKATKGTLDSSLRSPAARDAGPQAPQGTLLGQLKLLVQKAEAQQTNGQTLLSQLQNLVAHFQKVTQGQKGPPERRPAPDPPGPKPNARATAPQPSKWTAAPVLRLGEAHPKINRLWWKGKLVPVNELSERLDVGEAPEGNLALVSIDQVRQFRALARTHSLDAAVALLCPNIQDDQAAQLDGAAKKWFQMQDGRWKTLWVWPLAKELSAWPATPHVVEKAVAPTQVPLSTVRVTFSKQFLSANVWDLAQKRPTEALAHCAPEGASLRSFGWHHIPGEEAVIGFVKTSADVARSMIKVSGAKNAFFIILDDNKTRSTVRWLTKTEEQTATQYLAAARKQAQEHQTSLALRKGTKSCLGLIGLPPTESGQPLVRRWAARGVPKTWLPYQVQEVLAHHAFRVITELQPPKRSGGLWTFKASLQENVGPEGVAISFQDSVQLLVTPWISNRPKPQSTPLLSRRGWMTVPAVQHIAPTQLDPSTQAGFSGPPDPDATANGKGPGGPITEDVNMHHADRQKDNKRARSRTPPKDTGSKKALVSGPGGRNLSTGPDGVATWNLHGNGDCGFRCLGAQAALRKGGKVEDIAAKIEKLAMSLRTKTVIQLSGEASWRQSWYCDPDATTETEGGPVASDPSEYQLAAARPTKWLDPWLCEAAAKVLRRDVLVWKYIGNEDTGTWHFFGRHRCGARFSGDPFVLFLKDHHFQTLDPSTSPPSSLADSRRGGQNRPVPELPWRWT